MASVIAAIPATIGIAQAYRMARGDVLVMTEVIRRADLVAFLASASLRFIGDGLPILLMALHRSILNRVVGHAAVEQRYPRKKYLIAFCAFAVLAILLKPGLGMMPLVLAIGFEPLSNPGLTARSRFLDYLGVVIAAGLLILSVSYVATSPSPPPEVLKVQGRAIQWAYVLAVEDTHTTILHPSGGLERIPNDQVEGRAVCPERQFQGSSEKLKWDPLLGEWGASVLRISLRRSDEYVPDLCAAAPAVPSPMTPIR